MSERLFEALELAERLGGELEGGNPVVGALGSPGDPGEGMVVVVWDKRQAGVLTASPPALTVTHDGLELPTSLAAVIRVGDARLALARLTRLFDQRRLPAAGVHPQATVSPRARLGKGVRVAAGAIIGDDAIIGDACVIGQGAIVGEGSVIGEESRLHPRATVLDGVTVGRRVILHSGSVVGSDGFGYALGGAGAVKLHHLGGVVVEDDVEIGANTCIDRGTLGDTVIGARTKIDNLCQVAHNVRIGRDCLIAGQSGIAGSSKLGDRVVMAGGAGVGDHLEVGDGAVLGPRAGVTKDVPAGQRWMGFPAQPQRAFARQSYLAGKLERIWRFVKRHEEEEV